MTKRTFKPTRYEDLTGGVNVRDYPSEIEDKQAQEIENWNFKGNRLISAKGYQDTGLATLTEIGGLKVDSGVVWEVADDKIYKDGVEQTSTYGVRLKLTGVIKLVESPVTDSAGNVMTYQDRNEEYFPDGVYFYVDVDGTTYSATGNNKQEVYDSLSTQLVGAGYFVNIASEFIYISSNSPIVVTTTGINTQVIYNADIISSSTKWDYNTLKVARVEIGGTYRFFLNTEKRSDYDNDAFEFDKGLRDQMYTDIDALSGPEVDLAKSYLSPGFTEDGTGTIYGTEDPNGFASINVGNSADVNFGWSGQTIQIKSTSLYTSTHSVTIGGVDVFTFPIAGVTDNATFVTHLQANGYPNTRLDNGVPKGVGTTSYNCITPLGTNYEGYSVLLSNSTYADGQNLWDVDFQSFIIDTNTFESDTILNNLPSFGRANITIGNLGELIIDKDSGGAYYYTEEALYGLEEDEVGLPTVGTIYNGKIVLGGYSDNDNIVYSQTSTPSQPLNLLNFIDYSAGGQSVSGGDKGLITGMVTSENGLYVFKDNSIWYTNSEKDEPSSESFNFIFRKITSNGALSQNVITEVEQEVFYLDWKTREVRRLGYEQNLTTLRDVSISREISDLFDDLPEDQALATSSFNYPNYTLSLSDQTGGTITYNNGNTYYLNNKHFIYNVENKSWTTKTGLSNLIVSFEGHLALNDGKTYKDGIGNTTEDGDFLSKQYVFGDDIRYEKFGRFDIVGRIIPEAGQTKTLTIEIWIDGEKIDERDVSADSTLQVKEKIDLYDIGQSFEFRLKHSGVGQVEVFDVSIYRKGTTIQPQDYL